MKGIIFFQPDDEFVNWIIEYANGRFIIDVGAGTGHLAKLLNNKGAKVMIIEPLIDAVEWMQESFLGDSPNRIHLLNQEIANTGSFITPMLQNNKAILLFVRPCHSNFVVEGLNLLPEGAEALYITKPENLDDYNDIGRYESQAVLVDHTGTSEDNEVVYSIKK